MKKVIIVDWLDKYAGSERVIKSLDNVFKFDKCYTLINIMKQTDLSILFNNRKILIETSLLQIFGEKFRMLLPFFPFFSKQLKVSDDVDLIISSSHAVAKSVTNKNALHISYFQARNLKYIWEEQSLYFSGFKSIFKLFVPFLQNFDITGSKIPDYIIVNSKFVQKWVNDTYGRESTIIYPPVDVYKFSICDNKEDYYVTVGRLEPYKRFDILIKAFNINKKKLIVIGDGSQLVKLQEIGESNIEFTGYLKQDEINNYISKAKGFVFAGLEDFGIAPIEAQACGTPVVCLNQGGTAETIIHMKTGVHFNNQEVSDINKAITQLENHYEEFSPKLIRKHAEIFSRERFEKEIEAFVNEKYEIFKKERL